MGACCSKEIMYGEIVGEKMEYEEHEDEDEEDVMVGDGGAIVRLQGSSHFTSMFTKQGKKGINQDSMTIWENFTGEKDMFLCGVFDGHGPFGHRVARYVRDNLPSKIHSAIQALQQNEPHFDDEISTQKNASNKNDDTENQNDDVFFGSLKDGLINSFKEIDKELGCDPCIDCFCSGTTAVTIIKQGDQLVIGNLGDSRAVLGTRTKKNQLVPVQLTVDLKPNIPSEAERIKNCKGRIFAMDEEPNVYRIWLPHDDCPGLAMARAFGDFCLKNYGLSSVPLISHTKLTTNDEFVVLATDGVWDVLSNHEVVRIVGSTKKRSMAAKMVVNHAVNAWRYKYPSSKTDDCAVVCLFLKTKPELIKSTTESIRGVTSIKSDRECEVPVESNDVSPCNNFLRIEH